ncbi:SMP-30/gluconolactonase/LRE family protein [Sphingobium sp. CFD-2]|uniref:SMP-30/gluconolactonase/LRE family protein n=1 Tax=Sphingobium sp. CFD-2 TaxID=2878542 RepID=UPI00214AB99C|nr:SMP-30/gluconolactonase/LRE family protein [Sphingobium sp. CFD-2]
MRLLELAATRGARILAEGLFFPECPRFKGTEIIYVDGPLVRATSLAGVTRIVAALPAQLCLGLQITGDDILVGGALERRIYRIAGDTVSLEQDLSSHSASPTNEFVRLPGGSMLVGRMGFNPILGEAPRAARLLLVTPDGDVRETGPELMFANGMMLVDGGAILLVMETFAQQIRRLSLSPYGEVLSDTVLPLVNDPSPEPDGFGLAADGGIWYADMHLGAVVHRGEDGKADLLLRTGKAHATSCVIFNAEEQEWIAITATDHPPAPEFAHLRTGQLIVVPLRALWEAGSECGS